MTDWTDCASHCCGCGVQFTRAIATAIWHRQKWCKACARGLHPDGFRANGIEQPSGDIDPADCESCERLRIGLCELFGLVKHAPDDAILSEATQLMGAAERLPFSRKVAGGE